MRGSAMRIVRWNGESTDEQDDDLAEEEPLEIRVRGQAISVTMRTPGHDAELAAGFLLTEGIIRGPQDVLRSEHCDRNEHGNVLNVLLAPEVPVDFERLTRHVFASSSSNKTWPRCPRSYWGTATPAIPSWSSWIV